jgi:hypothetical protein
VPEFTIKGVVRDTNGAPIEGVKVFAMDSDQQFFEDYNDDLLGADWSKPDGTFKIDFSTAAFKENMFEGNPDIYFVVRNSKGEMIQSTKTKKGAKLDGDDHPFEIILTYLGKAESISDPYFQNQERIIAAFASLGDTTSVNIGEIARTFSLLNSSITAWTIYTQESTWNEIGYDGPQVPRYPLKVLHKHELKWEGTN